MHTRSIGIENARDLDLETMLAVIIKEQCFGTAFPLIVTRTRPDRIDIAPVAFCLGVDRRISIYFARRGLKDATFEALGEPQHVDCAVYRRLGRLHWVVLILNWRRGASEIIDLVNFHVEWKRHIVTNELETGMDTEMLNIPLGAREEIIDAQNVMPLLEQSIRQM
jgi:hypothetical protein